MLFQNYQWDIVSIDVFLIYITFYFIGLPVVSIFFWSEFLSMFLTCNTVLSLPAKLWCILIMLHHRCCFPVSDTCGSQKERILNFIHRKKKKSLGKMNKGFL